MNPSNDPFLRETLAEDGMPITAGYLPLDGSPSRPHQVASRVKGNWPRPISNELVEQLPKWARIAFAARCARRILPLHRDFSNSASYSAMAVNSIEDSAQQGKSSPLGAFVTMAKSFDQIQMMLNLPNAHEDRRVKNIIDLGLGLIEMENQTPQSTDYVLKIAELVYSLLVENAAQGNLWNLAAPSVDLELLVKLAKEENWTDDTPVSPDVFGPMWKGRPPKWWRVENLVY